MLLCPGALAIPFGSGWRSGRLVLPAGLTAGNCWASYCESFLIAN